MDTATVSVVVSGLVGVAGLSVALLTARMADKRQQFEIRDARFDELRDVIDQAAVKLMAVREAEPQLEEVREGFDKVREALPRLRTALMQVWQQEARLSARLGLNHEVVTLYAAAHEAVGELHTYWRHLLDGETPP